MTPTRTLLAIALAAFALSAGACHGTKHATTPREMPTPSIQVGACGTPGKDGVMSASPKAERADQDLNGDGVAEVVVVDRSMCTAEGNCYWNVFVPPPKDKPTDCARYAGTFAASTLEPLPAKGDDNMSDIRGYWNLHGGRQLLQSYRFARGGYQLVDALLCRKGGDDKLECMDEPQ